ncbi:esterase-like activity of phytase family protein [Microtetraspora niveoalba]|uniref:esterase-like activity of phytase family protein n=1 Tax=Microtetraspora niveoalba TaxID=46175 RepID=UPI003570D179
MWIGDEFGPFLLHVDGTGRLLQAPVSHPVLKAPQSPELASGETPTVESSRGFEAPASSPDGRYLYPAGDGNRFRRCIHEFDTRANRYTGRSWQYRTDGADHRIADMHSLDANRAILIEREDDEGPAATFATAEDAAGAGSMSPSPAAWERVRVGAVRGSPGTAARAAAPGERGAPYGGTVWG